MDRLLEGRTQRDEFFLLYSKLLQERIPGATLEFVEESAIRIVKDDGKQSTTYLDNLWLKYASGDEDRAELIERYVRMAMNLASSDVLATKQDIVAMIKDSRYIHQIQGQMTEHLCGDLWIVYAIDRPETVDTLACDSKTIAGVSVGELRALAVENLKRILPEVERPGDGPWYLLTAGANYVASLLLFDEMWNQLVETVDGDVVATVPMRDVLLYTGSRSVSGLLAIRERAVALANSGPHAISDSLILRDSGKWTIFKAN